MDKTMDDKLMYVPKDDELPLMQNKINSTCICLMIDINLTLINMCIEHETEKQMDDNHRVLLK